MSSFPSDWAKYVRQQEVRHLAAGIVYRAGDMPSEIVGRAIMSKKSAPDEYVSPE